MIRICTKNRIKWDLIGWLIVIIFMTDTSYISINGNGTVSDFADAIIILLTLICIIKKMRITKLVLFLSVSVLCTTILTGSIFRLTYYTVIFSIWFCFYFAEKYTIQDFAEYYLMIMRIIAIGSLVCWLFPKYFVSLSFFPQFTSSTGATYRFLGITTIPFATHIQRRNFGPFWEPGTYQVYLCVAIFLLLFVSKKKNKTFDLILFLIAEVTTMSGASVIPAGIMLAAYLLKERNMKSFFAVLLGCIVMAIMFDSGIFDSIILKITGEDSNSSLLFRWIGFEGGIRNFLAHPLFGSSFGEAQAVRDELALNYIGITYGSNTNTFANYFGSYGIFIGCFFLIASYQFFKKICLSRSVCVIAFVGYFLSTSNENLTGSLLVIVIAMLGWYGVNHDRELGERFEKYQAKEISYEQKYMYNSFQSE